MPAKHTFGIYSITNTHPKCEPNFLLDNKMIMNTSLPPCHEPEPNKQKPVEVAENKMVTT